MRVKECIVLIRWDDHNGEGHRKMYVTDLDLDGSVEDQVYDKFYNKEKMKWFDFRWAEGGQVFGCY